MQTAGRFYDVTGAIDIFALCIPIYLDHITARTMAFIRRTYCYLGAKLENHYSNKNLSE